MSINQTQGTGNTSPENPKREGIVRIAPLMVIPALLKEHGCAPAHVFRQAGLSLELFNDPETEISFVSASRLMEASATASSCEHFGLLLAERIETSSLGLAGLLLRCAPDPGIAIRTLRDHLNLHDSGGLVIFDIVNDTARFGYQIIQPGAMGIDHIYDLATAVACKIMRNLCGAHWSPVKVCLSRNMPLDPIYHARYFHAPIEFSASGNYLEFPAMWLNHLNLSADPHLFKYLSERAGELQTMHRPSLLSSLRRVMLNAIIQQRCSVEYVAGMLGMHQRTLNRKLGELNTSFRQELEKQRFELARQMLVSNHISISEVASFLGYSEQAAFSRAFKRWSGQSPSIWRLQGVK